MRFIAKLGGELFDSYACLILILGTILAGIILGLSQFETFHSETYHFDTPHFEMSRFENRIGGAVTYIRKGEKFQMKKSFLDFVKSQLEEIRISKNAEYSSGIAATLIAYIDAENPPETIELSISSVRNGNLINAIKELRGLTGFGLKESKDHVEQGTVFYSGTDTNKAINMYKVLNRVAIVNVKGSPAMQTLFGQN